jgi:hypothetical protein
VQMDSEELGAPCEDRSGVPVAGFRICRGKHNQTDRNNWSVCWLHGHRSDDCSAQHSSATLATLPRRGSLKVVSWMAVDARRSVCAIIQRILCCLSCAGVVRENARTDKSSAARRRSNAEGGCGCELRPLVLWLFPELVRVRLDASQLLRSPATRLLSLPTTDSAVAPTGSTGEGRMKREGGSAAREEQCTITGKRAVSKGIWSTASQSAPFPRAVSLCRALALGAAPSVFPLVLVHLCSFWPETSRIVISVMPDLRGKRRGRHPWGSGSVDWSLQRGCNEGWPGVRRQRSAVCNSHKQQSTHAHGSV